MSKATSTLAQEDFFYQLHTSQKTASQSLAPFLVLQTFQQHTLQVDTLTRSSTVGMHILLPRCTVAQ